MFILLFACWVIFNQNFTLEIALFGVAISAVVYLFICKFMDYSVQKDLFIMKKFPRILAYILRLIVEILKANFTLFRIYFSKKKNREPVIVSFETSLQTRIGRSLLANSITLTPGTITMELKGNVLKVHCYDKSLAVGLDHTVFEEKIKKLEEGFDA